jgi:hypothetical protein
MTLVLTAFALGLAGLDPAGALVVAGAREGHVVLFGLVVLVGTVALGTTLSLTVGPRVAEIDRSVFAPRSDAWSRAPCSSSGRSSCWTRGGGSSPENCWYRTDQGNVGDSRFGPQSAGSVSRAFPEVCELRITP